MTPRAIGREDLHQKFLAITARALAAHAAYLKGLKPAPAASWTRLAHRRGGQAAPTSRHG